MASIRKRIRKRNIQRWCRPAAINTDPDRGSCRVNPIRPQCALLLPSQPRASRTRWPVSCGPFGPAIPRAGLSERSECIGRSAPTERGTGTKRASLASRDYALVDGCGFSVARSAAKSCGKTQGRGRRQRGGPMRKLGLRKRNFG